MLRRKQLPEEIIISDKDNKVIIIQLRGSVLIETWVEGASSVRM